MPEALFVGREREKELYSKFLLKDTPWVLIITGLGGIGKTTLLHQLADYTKTQPSLPVGATTVVASDVVMLDFNNEVLRTNPLKVLEQLTSDTAPFCDLVQIDKTTRNELQTHITQLTRLSTERTQTGVVESDDTASYGLG